MLLVSVDVTAPFDVHLCTPLRAAKHANTAACKHKLYHPSARDSKQNSYQSIHAFQPSTHLQVVHVLVSLIDDLLLQQLCTPHHSTQHGRTQPSMAALSVYKLEDALYTCDTFDTTPCRVAQPHTNVHHQTTAPQHNVRCTHSTNPRLAQQITAGT